MNELFLLIKKVFKDRFNLHDDKASDDEINESIRKNVDFKGANLWALVFAIFIASIGLNVNSTAVIIGAMLISPIMGPIMGIGLGIGINDFDLVKKGAKNLAIAASISIATSALYFWATPLREAQSELLSRTTPSIWDVFIAFFGGMAGIVAGTRREKSNVIPGVAIATALMPPLCTAGFGLASGNLLFFLGALYLFFINSLFICIATYLVTKALRIHKKSFSDPERERKVARYILTIVIITILPSIYLAYGIVGKSIFEANANKFIHNEFKFANTQVVDKTFKYSNSKKEIDLLLIGEELTPVQIDTLKGRLPNYNITSCDLHIRQGLNAKQQIDFSQIKASILEEVFSQESDSAKVRRNNGKLADKEMEMPDIKSELNILYPTIKEYSIAKAVINNMDSTRKDTVVLFYAKSSSRYSQNDKLKMQKWLKSRTHKDSVIVLLER